jgi:hypothetical protein
MQSHDVTQITAKRGRHCWLYWNHPGYRRLWTELADLPSAPKPPQSGPGTELKKLFAELGITDFAGCSCNANAAQMNDWGVEWFTKIGAAIRSSTIGVAHEIDLADVAGSLVRIAMHRAVQ